MENQAKLSPEERGAEWLKSGKTGASSKTVYNFFISGPPNDPHYPHDSADLWRVFGLLDAVPEWRPRMGELAAIPGLDGQVWAALVPHLDKWKGRMDSNEKGAEWVSNEMKEIIEPLEAASGEVAKLGKGITMRVKKDAGPIAQALLLKSQGASDEDIRAALQKAVSETSTDEELLQAARYIVASTKPTCSGLQRHLGINYNRAARLMEMLEKEGSVTPADSGGVRQVSEKLAKAYGITQRIDEIAKATGATPEKVFETAKAQIGHNSGDEPEAIDIGGVSGKRLRAYLDRVERLEEEKQGIAEDIKDIYAEAKGVGFDTKILRKLYRLRKMNTDKRREEEELLELYNAAVGLD